ncbi:MAG: ABC transporter ATP-binding protein [Bryobacteraceae bacterium]|nr:ABC transporter ATP-binding protein [Bryobacteraceae bacterium]
MRLDDRRWNAVGGAPAVIALEHVYKTYAGAATPVRALRDVSLTVRRGEFIAIMGASGSGKSTLLNILGCLDRPSRGWYYLDGIDVSKMTPDQRADIRNRKLGFVFQGFNLLPRTSAVENVELPLLYSDAPAAERLRRSRAALAMVGLSHREQNHPSQLSGGQQQRVAIARSLVNRPALLLADEPTGNLDTRTSIDIMTLFQQLNRERGITIVLVTHEPDIAAYARRMVVMRDGRIVRDEPVENTRDAAVDLASLAPDREEVMT